LCGNKTKKKGLLMAKVLFILMPNYREEEFSIPHKMLLAAKHIVDVAALAPGVPANLKFSNLTEQDFIHYDALVIPGGAGSTTYLWNNEKVQNVIKYFHSNKKLVAAICYAVIAVVQSGILLNKHATVFPTDEAKAILDEYGVRFSKDLCVTLKPEKIITAQGPTAAEKFGLEILKLLEASK
jgi:protein deglycase